MIAHYDTNFDMGKLQLLSCTKQYIIQYGLFVKQVTEANLEKLVLTEANYKCMN